MTLKAILSDAGGILFDDSHTKTREYNYLSRFMRVSYRDFMASFYPFKEKTQVRPGYTRDDAFSDYLALIGREDLLSGFKEYAADYSNRYYGDPSALLRPGVKDSLRLLKSKGVKFVVLTDSSQGSAEYGKFLERCGIAGDISDIISSKDLGVKKPHPDFFRYALERHGLDVKDAAFVGHDHDELKGAHDFGLEVIALNYQPELVASGELSFVPKENLIASFSDILRLVGSR